MAKTGISCRVVRSENGEITGAKDIHGKDSRLFNQALEVVGDKATSANVWATAYTDEMTTLPLMIG